MKSFLAMSIILNRLFFCYVLHKIQKISLHKMQKFVNNNQNRKGENATVISYLDSWFLLVMITIIIHNT